MNFFADFHIHSKYSRATSPQMIIPLISQSAKMKGIKLMGTGDFTHPEWLSELKKELTPIGDGIFNHKETYFILTTEVSNIYEKHGKLRKIHNLIFAPNFEVVDKINAVLAKYGNLEADGRPTLTVHSEVMTRELLALDPSIFIVPAHIWTPWFSLFGANSGFDAIEECFDKEPEKLGALETGLSSDPPMNARWSAIDRFALISNSDAHSPQSIGREANYFECELNYYEITQAIKNQDAQKFKFTIEFFPEEGKYHWDGHRKCEVRISPEEAIVNDNLCPKCGKKLTIGVMHRVVLLSDRKVPSTRKIGYKHLIPLLEIIADTLSVGKETETVLKEYNKLIYHFGSEFNCLLEVPYEELQNITSPQIAQSICNVREGKVEILPGYDGVYGKISVKKEKIQEPQLKLF